MFQGYEVKNTVNGKTYQGVVVSPKKNRTWKKRVYAELSLSNNPNEHYSAAIRKYGKDAFEAHCTGEFHNIEDLLFDETVRIVRSKSYLPEFGYNKSFGGEGRVWTEESKKIHYEAVRPYFQKFIDLKKDPVFAEKQRKASSENMTRLNADPEFRAKLNEACRIGREKWYKTSAFLIDRKIISTRICHIRWHVNRGIVNPNCKLCVPV